MAKLEIPTINEVDYAGKSVFCRVDFNVPMDNGVITDDYRIRQSLPTLQKLIEAGCKVIVAGHLGRPGGKPDKSLSMLPIRAKLEQLIGRPVLFAGDILSQITRRKIAQLKGGEIMLLENLRFWAGEEENNEIFGDQLSDFGEIYVQNAFGNAHRSHASMDSGPRQAKLAVLGDLFASEYGSITEITNSPHRPFTAVIGGAKVTDKIDLLLHFMKQADNLIIGGAMANNFLAAQGFDVEDSLVDKADIQRAKDILRQAEEQKQKRRFTMAIPQDVVVGHSIKEEHTPSLVDLSSFHFVETVFYPKKPPENTIRLNEGELIGDIGPYSTAYARGIIAASRTVVWNGLVGVVETPASGGEALGPFEFGSYYLAHEIADQTALGQASLIGGGDTAGFVGKKGMTEKFTHVSTGGGSSMALIAGQELPAISALKKKSTANA